METYQCHKRVEAAKIREIDGDLLRFEGTRAVAVSIDWIERHKPQVGGYYVRYEDGYTSYSPAKAFEEGYTLIVQGEGS